MKSSPALQSSPLQYNSDMIILMLLFHAVDSNYQTPPNLFTMRQQCDYCNIATIKETNLHAFTIDKMTYTSALNLYSISIRML